MLAICSITFVPQLKPAPPSVVLLPHRTPRVILADGGLSEDAVQARLAALRRGKKKPAGRRIASEPAGSPQPEVRSEEIAAPPTPAEARKKSPKNEEDQTPPLERLRAKVAARAKESAPLDASAVAAIVCFLNDYLGDEMLGWVLVATDVGAQASRKNAWSGGSWVPKSAVLEELSGTSMRFRVGVAERGKAEMTTLTTELPLPRAVETVDELRDVLLELGNRAGKGGGACSRMPPHMIAMPASSSHPYSP